MKIKQGAPQEIGYFWALSSHWPNWKIVEASRVGQSSPMEWHTSGRHSMKIDDDDIDFHWGPIEEPSDLPSITFIDCDNSLTNDEPVT